MLMLWVSVAFALLLLLALLFPFIEPRLSDGRRSRRAHRGDVLHWYPNFDEDLRFEPRHDDDIVLISRSDLELFGYHAGSEAHLVPRTFRNRVAGDRKMRLWTSSDTDLRPVWVCAWASVQLPGPGNEKATTPLSPDLLARIHSGPSAVIDDDAHVPREASGPLGDAWPAHEEEMPVEELHHDVRRFGCTEGTPLSFPMQPETPQDSSADQSDEDELVFATVGVSSRKNRRKRGRRGRRG